MTNLSRALATEREVARTLLNPAPPATEPRSRVRVPIVVRPSHHVAADDSPRAWFFGAPSGAPAFAYVASQDACGCHFAEVNGDSLDFMLWGPHLSVDASIALVKAFCTTILGTEYAPNC